MPTVKQDTIELLYKAFQENPNRLTYSTEKLQKQYNASQQEVQKARKLYRINPKDFVVAQAVSLGSDKFNDCYYDSIPASELFETLTGEKDQTWLFMCAKKVEDWANQSLEEDKEAIKKIDQDIWDKLLWGFDVNTTSQDFIRKPLSEKDNWEVKQKWVKNKETGESSLLVRKANTEDLIVDHKKEFEKFIVNSMKDKNFEWNYEDKTYKVRPELCLVLCLFDLHIGRESHVHYTGDSTGLNVQHSDFVNSLNALVQSVPFQKVEKIILPIGNDFFNVDNIDLETTKRTKQDNTKDLHSMYYTGLNLLVECSLYLSSIAPVELILVPGNHDTLTSSFLATSLKVFFKDNPLIEVDDSPISRKYRKYGQTTLGFAHGELKMEKYAELLPYEAKEMFANSKWYEFLLGDKHHEKYIQKEEGVVVRHLGGLTKADVWTYNSGYTTSKRRAYGILYHKDQGRTMEIIHQL